MEPRRFNVLYEDGRLQIEDKDLTVRLVEDEVVIFNFAEVPEGRVPGVFFQHCFLGPFLNVHQTGDSIVLKGNSGRIDTFRCTPWIAPKVLGQDPPLLAVNSVQFENYSERIRPATHVRVLIAQEDPQQEPTVTVDAERISVNETDVAIWSFVFQDVADIFRPLLYFEEPEKPWGPFRSLSSLPVSEKTDEGEVRFRLVGEGITSEVKSYRYSVGVVQILLGDSPGLGKVYRVEHDPIIDSSGPPHV